MKTFTKGLILLGIFVFVYIAFATSGGTTLRGNTLTYNEGGVLDNIINISLRGDSLLIIDGNRLTPIAIFNADIGEISDIAQSMQVGNGPLLFPNTSTGFLGDVNNFDDINGTSRFRENNLNSGSNAISAFTAENDIGKSVNLGIGSSNFMVGNRNRSNQAALISFTESGLNFANILGGGWSWVNNPSEDITNSSREEVMNLTEQGSLEIDGNFSGNQFYGEMFGLHVLTPEIINIPSLAIINSSGVFNTFKITGFEEGELNGFTFFNDTLIVNKEGLYNIKFGVTYSNTAQGRHVIILVKNDFAITKVVGAGYVANANDIRSVTGSGFVRVEVGDILQINVGDRFNPATPIEVLSSEFNLIRMAN